MQRKSKFNAAISIFSPSSAPLNELDVNRNRGNKRSTHQNATASPRSSAANSPSRTSGEASETQENATASSTTSRHLLASSSPGNNRERGKASTADADLQYLKPLTPSPKRFEHIRRAFGRFIHLDTHFILSAIIFLIVGLIFVTEFLFYVIVKLLVNGLEDICTPSKVKSLRREMLEAKTSDEFRKIAKRLDVITGRESWKARKESPDYDWRLVEKRQKQMRVAREGEDLRGLLVALKNSVDTQFFQTRAGVLEESLYSRTYDDTKYLINEFLSEVCQCLDKLQTIVSHKGKEINEQQKSKLSPSSPFSLASPPPPSSTGTTPTVSPLISVEFPRDGEAPPLESSREGSGETRESTAMDTIRMVVHQLRCQWGCTALVLSGGASLGWHHFGVIEPLIKEGILPRVICGTSAGAAVAAWLCTRTDDELVAEFDPEYLGRTLRPLQPDSWMARFRNFLRNGFVCEIDLWQRLGLIFYGRMTFIEAYHKTGRVLNVSLTRADRDEPPLILNYKNGPHVLIASAVIASCSFPILGPPFHLKEKAPNGDIIDSTQFECEYFHDGSIMGDVPLAQLKEIWGIQFAIVSQVNPHVFPFCGLRAHGEAGRPVAWRGNSGNGNWRGGFLLSGMEVILKEHMRFLLRLIVLLDLSPTFKGVSVGNLVQPYCGDITIHPRRFFWTHRRLLNDPTIDEVTWYIQEGRQMAFPKMSIIRNRLHVERALERLYNETVGGNVSTGRMWRIASMPLTLPPHHHHHHHHHHNSLVASVQRQQQLRTLSCDGSGTRSSLGGNVEDEDDLSPSTSSSSATRLQSATGGTPPPSTRVRKRRRGLSSQLEDGYNYTNANKMDHNGRGCKDEVIRHSSSSKAKAFKDARDDITTAIAAAAAAGRIETPETVDDDSEGYQCNKTKGVHQ